MEAIPACKEIPGLRRESRVRKYSELLADRSEKPAAGIAPAAGFSDL
jgi:hypothetical protein